MAFAYQQLENVEGYDTFCELKPRILIEYVLFYIVRVRQKYLCNFFHFSTFSSHSRQPKSFKECCLLATLRVEHHSVDGEDSET